MIPCFRWQGQGRHLKSLRAEPDISFCVLNPRVLKEAANGTRTSALADWCASSGNHSVVVVLRPLTNRGGMNEIHQLANALLTVVFAAAMFVVGHLYIEKMSNENSDHQPRRSGIRAMDEPSVTTFLLTRQRTDKATRH